MSDELNKHADEGWDAEELQDVQESFAWAAGQMPFLFREGTLNPDDPVDKTVLDTMARRRDALRKMSDGEQ